MHCPAVENLAKLLTILPGIGPRSAQRIAYNILEKNKKSGLKLANTLIHSIQTVQNCQQCRTLTDTPICKICTNPERKTNLLCITETPSDMITIEQTGAYKGNYFVLNGYLSPLEGIGPTELGIKSLIQLVEDRQINEVIIATNPSIEGDATAYYIFEQFKHKPIKCTRLAHGIPMGGELEYLDGRTLTHALQARTTIKTTESSAG